MKTGRFPFLRINSLQTALMALLIPLALCNATAGRTAEGPDMSEATIKRGEAIFRTSCQACHSLKYSGYETKMNAGSARKAFGKVAPDLNLMTKARGRGSKGAAYVNALLTGYNDTQEKNSVFPNIAMPPAFSKSDPEAARKAREVSAFLADAAEPSEHERRGLGGYVVGYMAALTVLLYALNRRTWKGITRRK
jgi:cytochrome c1